MSIRLAYLCFIVLFVTLLPARAERIPSHCLALAEGVPGVRTAALSGLEAMDPAEVRLHYVGHSTFVIETPGGLTMATDYTGFIGGDLLPDVATMNRAHSSHYTLYPDPAIPHVLRGWGEEGRPADHYLDLGEVLVRNVTTDIRGGGSGRIPDGNSIFVFEVAGLCIGHLGHIHHEPSDEQYALMGRMDIVLAPVDGGMTVPVPLMIKILKRVRASLVIPMHWFGDGTLSWFLDGMADEFQIDRSGGNSVTMSLDRLPRSPTVRLLMPRPVAP